jgi:hypothetical protein
MVRGAMLAAAALWALAAAPALALPDWNGMWMPVRPPRAPGAPRPSADPASDKLPSLTPPYQAIYDKAQALFAKGDLSMDKTVNCEPAGMPLMMSFDNGGEVLMTPGRVTVISEFAGDVRRIFTDGRQHPADLDLSYEGHSIGHWEGDDLVVDTVAISPKASLNLVGSQQSDKMHITERFHSPEPGRLNIRFHIEDPEAFTKPWDYTVMWQRDKDPLDYVHEYYCDNNRNKPKSAER